MHQPLLQIRLLPPLESNPQHLHCAECWYLKLENGQENMRDKKLNIEKWTDRDKCNESFLSKLLKSVIALTGHFREWHHNIVFHYKWRHIKLTRVHNLKESTLTFFVEVFMIE